MPVAVPVYLYSSSVGMQSLSLAGRQRVLTSIDSDTSEGVKLIL